MQVIGSAVVDEGFGRTATQGGDGLRLVPCQGLHIVAGPILKPTQDFQSFQDVAQSCHDQVSLGVTQMSAEARDDGEALNIRNSVRGQNIDPGMIAVGSPFVLASYRNAYHA